MLPAVSALVIIVIPAAIEAASVPLAGVDSVVCVALLPDCFVTLDS